jgi:hypothetical protein
VRHFVAGALDRFGEHARPDARRIEIDIRPFASKVHERGYAGQGIERLLDAPRESGASHALDRKHDVPRAVIGQFP